MATGPGDGAHIRPDISVSAEDLITRLGNINRQLTTFKGTGSIRLLQNGAVVTGGRLVWAGEMPVRLHAVLLVSGHPVLKMAADGRRITYHNMMEEPPRYRTIRSKDPDLSRLLSLSIKNSELMTLLSGRVPIVSHHSVQYGRGDVGTEPVLILKKRRRDVERIYLDKDSLEPNRIEIFNRSGELVYGVAIVEKRKAGAYLIPAELRIYGNKEQTGGVHLHIDRFWPNAPVSPSQFIIPPPD